MKINRNEKGFTLVEILVAITILGIISVVAIAGVQTVMNNNRTKYYKSLREMIIAAAKEYYSDNKRELPIDVDESADPLYVSTLIDNDYLDPVKNANGDKCDNDNSYVLVTKEGAKEYRYTLHLTCNDPKMPDEISDDEYTPKTGAISVQCNPINGGKKVKAYLTLSGRSDYRYEVLKYNKDSNKYETVNNKKGNIKDGKNRVEIPVNYGSGKYKVRATTGTGQTDEKECEIKSAVPDCDGIDYKVSHVAKEWFRGTLEVTVKSDKEKAERYNIDKFEIKYKQIDEGSDKTTGKQNISKAFNNGTTESYNFNASRGEVSVFVYNDVNDKKECKLGEYWMDNEAPTCTNQKANSNWTNSRTAKAVTDCDDHDTDGGKKGVKQSGCMQDKYEDSTEDEYTDFNYSGASDKFYIQDKVGNVAKGDSNCRFLKRIDRTAPRCSSVSQYGTTDWGKNKKAWARCIDDQKSGVTPSQCTSATSYQEEGSPDGATKTFTIRDNAGNTASCTADKHRDNVAPSCTGSKFSNWVNTRTKRAYADCNDNSGSGRSGCKEDRVYESSTTEGERTNITVEDYAGNTKTCSAEKKRDTTPPSCASSVTTTKQTSPGTCYGRTPSSYPCGTIPGDPNADPPIPSTTQWCPTYDSTRKDYTYLCYWQSTVQCSDSLSKCTSNTFAVTSNHHTGWQNVNKLSDRNWVCSVSSAVCPSSEKPSSVTIRDNAGNTKVCYPNTTPEKPTPDNNPPTCDLISWDPKASDTEWIIQDGVDVQVSWDTSSNINVEYVAGNAFSGAVTSRNNHSMTIHFGQGVYDDGKLRITKNGKSTDCRIGNYRIDNVPPKGDFTYRTTNVTKYGHTSATNDRCFGNITIHNAPLNGQKDFIFNTEFKNILFTDDISGVAKLRYQLAPVYWIHKEGLNDLDLTPGQINDGNPIWIEEQFYDSHPGTVQESSYIGSTGMFTWDYSEAYTGGYYCYDFCVAVGAYDAAGNVGQAGSYGISTACTEGDRNRED